MNTVSNCQIKSINSDATELIAWQIGNKLRGGEVIELVSDLGGGKTVFVKGLVRGAGSNDEVTSPTFTISKIYRCPLFDIHHFDFYRLNNPGIVQLELQEVLADIKVVTVIEWANVVADLLPDTKLTIKIDIQANDERLIEIAYPESLNYLLEDLKC